MQGVRTVVRLVRVPPLRKFQYVARNACVREAELAWRDGETLRSAGHVSKFRSIGSSMAAGLFLKGFQLHDCECKSQVRDFCTQSSLQEGHVLKKRPSGDPQKLYEEIVALVEKKMMPHPHQLQELIRSSSSASEVAFAMDAADRLRSLRMMEKGEKGSSHNKEVTHMMVAAYLRAGDKQNALKLLWRKNPSGFTSSIGTAHLLLKHAKFHKDVKFMRQILRAMKANDVTSTVTTADIILRLCKESGEIDLMFSLAKDYNKVGLIFHESLFDILISSAANAGDTKLVHEIQSWRDKQGLVHTTASAVSVAKALVLEGKPKHAAKLIKEHCPDNRNNLTKDETLREKRDRYLGILVKVWPLQLVTALKIEMKEEYLRKLKEDVACMFDALKDLGLTIEKINVGENFAQGKGSNSAAQKEVKNAEELLQGIGDL